MEPKIRIQGHREDWKNSVLGELFRERIESSPQAEMLSVTMNNGVICATENGRFDNSNSDKSKYRLVKAGDIAYNSMRMWQGASGCSAYEGIVSPAYTVVTPIDEIDSQFFAILFKTPKVINLFKLNSQGLTSDTWNLKFNAFSKINVNYPLSVEEQRSIKDYFLSLDKLIRSSVKKIDSLRQMKAASLQAMFPQKGETRPRVRFKGFEDEYSSMTANELFKTFDERNHPELPVLSAYQDIRGMAPRSESGYDIFHDKSNEVTYKRVLPGQFVIHLRSFQGGFAHSSVEGICSPAYTVFGFKEDDKHDDYYWKYIFMSKAFIDRLKLITYGIRDGRSISFKEFMEMNFVFPSYEEQKQISIFFRTIDKQISLEEQKLESLKRIKSACLDKMFV